MTTYRPINAKVTEHARFLRAVGRHLLMSEDDIDDAVQATLLTSLHKRPRDDQRARPWLATVFRNEARKTYRSSGRRNKREQVASRKEALPSTFELASKRELIQSVSRAVLALNEPYRSVVIYRYYDGLPPRAIGERLGVSVETIRSRLRRARSQLRQQLDDVDPQGRSDRDWRNAMVILVGKSHVGALTKGGSMFTHTWIFASASAVAIAGGVLSVAMIGDVDRSSRIEPLIEMSVPKASQEPASPVDHSEPGRAVHTGSPMNRMKKRRASGDTGHSPSRQAGAKNKSRSLPSKHSVSSKGDQKTALLKRIHSETLHITFTRALLKDVGGAITLVTRIPIRATEAAREVARGSEERVDIKGEDGSTIADVLDQIVFPFDLCWRVENEKVWIDVK